MERKNYKKNIFLTMTWYSSFLFLIKNTSNQNNCPTLCVYVNQKKETKQVEKKSRKKKSVIPWKKLIYIYVRFEHV